MKSIDRNSLGLKPRKRQLKENIMATLKKFLEVSQVWVLIIKHKIL